MHCYHEKKFVVLGCIRVQCVECLYMEQGSHCYHEIKFVVLGCSRVQCVEFLYMEQGSHMQPVMEPMQGGGSTLDTMGP